MRGRLQSPTLSRVQHAERNHEHWKQRKETLAAVEEALLLLEQGSPLSTDDLIKILQKCRKEKSLENGLRCYAYLRKHGLEAHQSLGNYLVPMLVDVGRMQDAQDVFDRLPLPNLHSWNSLLSGYVNCGKAQLALTLYKRIQVDSLYPNEHTFVPLLNACAKLADKENGGELHAEIVRRGLAGDFLVASTLVHMYAKCGLLELAQEVFDELHIRDAIIWTSLIAGYVKLGHSEQALVYFDKMQIEGLSPNPLTFVCSLKACGCVGVLNKGQVMHAEIARRGLLEKDVFVGNALIDMYTKCGSVAKAQEVFDKLPTRDLVSWNALTTGYASIGNSNKAFYCFEQMQLEEVSPDAVTLVCNLKACSSTGELQRGQQLHVESVSRGFSHRVPPVGNALVDMYANCGFLAEAQNVFDSLNVQDAIAWTALIAGYSKYGFPKQALDSYQHMQLKGVTPDVVTYICTLKACSSIGDFHKGREMHAEIERLNMLERYTNIGTALLDFYASCGLLGEAQELFDRLSSRDVLSWNALILGYITLGHGEEVLKFFDQMQSEDVSPDANTLVYTLRACSSVRDLCKGREIHSEIIKQNILEAFGDIGTALIDMYFGCGSLREAQIVFDKLLVQDLSSWNMLISGFVNYGLYHEALSYFEQVFQGATLPDSCTYVCGLKACGSIKAESKCHQLHAEVIKRGLLKRSNSGVPSGQTTVLWNAVITAYLAVEHNDEALNCFKQVKRDDISLDVVTYICSLKACGSAGAPAEGHKIHISVVKLGLLEDDIMIGTALVDMYASCSMLGESKDVFNRLVVRDAVAWNALISGHVKHGYNSIALECVEQMKLEGILPNAVTYACVLNACGNIGDLKRGEIIHAHISGQSLETDSIGNALVGMYAKSGSFAKAQDILQKVSVRDVSLWNTLIAGCSRHGLDEEALSFYEQMYYRGVIPDAVTFICSLKACSSTGRIEKGREMHTVIIKMGLLRKEFLIVGNGLVDVYAKCGLLAEARRVFDTLPAKDTVSWNTLIAGNVINDCYEEALIISKQMHRESVSFDVATYLCSLKACGRTDDSDYGLVLHSEIVKKGLLECSLFTGNALIDMYVCCGLLIEAQDILQKLPFRDVVSWTILIAGFLRHGCDEEALLNLQEMQQEGVPSDVLMWNALIAGYSHLGDAEKACCILESMKGVKPNEDSFQSILAACSHAGLVKRGQMYFQAMEKAYGITPSIEHCTCLVDLFGRAGQVDEALRVIKEMPFQPDIVAWHTLMASCQKWGNVAVGIEAFQYALKLDEKDSASFVCMHNIFAVSDKDDAEIMVDAMEEAMT